MKAQRESPAQSPVEERQAEIDEILERLRKLIRLSGLRYRDIEERHGWGKDYIGQVLTGSVHISMDHLLAILRSLEISPEQFFDHLDRRPRS